MMEGKSVVAVSLPVRVFEKRSMVEKICDYWCTGPLYLKKAGQQLDPVERMKYLVTFVISGLH